MANRFAPTSLDDFIGQEEVKEMLRVEIKAVKNSGFEKKFPHTLLMGPSGTGKSTLAQAIAAELEVPIELVQAKRITNNQDLFDALPDTDLHPSPQYILFIDEIHEMRRIVQEELFLAMQEGILDVRDFWEKKTGDSMVKTIDVSGLIVLGATTREGDLEIPLKNRFGLHVYLEKYSNSAIKKIVGAASRKLMVEIKPDVLDEIAKRSRGVPRVALSLLERLESVALAEKKDIDRKIAEKCWELLLIDSLGLTRQDYRVLKCLETHGRMGMKSLIAQTELSASSIRTIEPYLAQLDLIRRGPKGREITEKGKKYIYQKKVSRYEGK